MQDRTYNKGIVTSQQLFYFNLIVGGLFVLYFLLGRKKVEPTRLNLKKKNEDAQGNLQNDLQNKNAPQNAAFPTDSKSVSGERFSLGPASESTGTNEAQQIGTSQKAEPSFAGASGGFQSSGGASGPSSFKTSLHQKVTILEPESAKDAVFKSKELGVFFVYNGHDWEAHAVLGVPQGASLPTVTKAYQSMLMGAAPEQFVFLETAYKALLTRKSKDRL